MNCVQLTYFELRLTDLPQTPFTHLGFEHSVFSAAARTLSSAPIVCFLAPCGEGNFWKLPNHVSLYSF